LLRLGRFEESIPSCERAIAISPRDSRAAIWHGLIGLDQFMLGRYALAAKYTRRTVASNSKLKGYWPVLAASLALDGRREEGERALHEFLAIEPDFTSAQIPRSWSGAQPRFTEGLERMTSALRELGLP